MKTPKIKRIIDFFNIFYLLTAIGSIVIILAFLGAYFILKKGNIVFILMGILTFSVALIVSILHVKGNVSIAAPGKMKDKKTRILMGLSAIIIGVSSIYITITKSQLTAFDIIFSGLFILGGISLILEEPNNVINNNDKK